MLEKFEKQLANTHSQYEAVTIDLKRRQSTAKKQLQEQLEEARKKALKYAPIIADPMSACLLPSQHLLIRMCRLEQENKQIKYRQESMEREITYDSDYSSR